MGGIHHLILMLLLTILTHLGVQLTAEHSDVKVKAPAGVLTEDLREAMTEHKAALLQFARSPYVETIDGLGTLTGHIEERNLFLVAPERQEALCSRIGVMSLRDGTERFYYPRMVLLARKDSIQVDEQRSEIGSP